MEPAALVKPRARSLGGHRQSPERGHVEWPSIDEVPRRRVIRVAEIRAPQAPVVDEQLATMDQASSSQISARAVILQRRSAVRSTPAPACPRGFPLDAGRLQPDAPPWDAIDWPPQVHLAMFVHRVDG